MQNSGLVRLAHSVLARPCCQQEAYAIVTKSFQYPYVQRGVSMSATARDSSEPADSSDTASKSQQAASGVKDVAKVVHANELRQLRRKWKAQHAEKLAIKAKADAKKAANKAVMIEGHRRNVAAMKELRNQIHEEKRRLQTAEMVWHMFAVVAETVLSYCHAGPKPLSCTGIANHICMSSCLQFQYEYEQALCSAGTTTSSCSSIQICNSACLCTA